MARRWYVIHTYSGYENKVKTNIEQLIETQGLENNICLLYTSSWRRRDSA